MMAPDRIRKLTIKLAAARARARAARWSGDTSGYLYALAEYRRLARILAEG